MLALREGVNPLCHLCGGRGNLLFKNLARRWPAGAQVPPPRFLGIKFGPNDAAPFGDGKLPSPQFGIFCLAVVIALAVVVCNLRRSATGRQLLAVRTNERAAAAGGISVAGAKLLAFALASFIAGIGGALSAYRFGSVSAASFGSFASIGFLAFAYLGGISSVTGAVIGGTLGQRSALTALRGWCGSSSPCLGGGPDPHRGRSTRHGRRAW